MVGAFHNDEMHVPVALMRLLVPRHLARPPPLLHLPVPWRLPSTSTSQNAGRLGTVWVLLRKATHYQSCRVPVGALIV